MNSEHYPGCFIHNQCLFNNIRAVSFIISVCLNFTMVLIYMRYSLNVNMHELPRIEQ